MLAVTVTYITALGGLFGFGRYPLTIHSAGWGILCNLGTATLLSALDRGGTGRSHRDRFHDFLREHTQISSERAVWKKPAWILTIVWFLFAIGPFAVLGNETDSQNWIAGVPSLWIWQVAWWVVGCFMMYLLAFKLQMSTVPDREIETLHSND